MLSDELDLSQTEIARRVGKSRPAVANTMRLLELPDDVLELIAGGKLSPRVTAAPCCSRPGRTSGWRWPGGRSTRGLSVRDTEAAAKRHGTRAAGQAGRAPSWVDEELAHLAVDAAWQSLKLRAAVRSRPARRQRRDPLRARPPSWAGSSISCAPSASPGPTDGCRRRRLAARYTCRSRAISSVG